MRVVAPGRYVSLEKVGIGINTDPVNRSGALLSGHPHLFMRHGHSYFRRDAPCFFRSLSQDTEVVR